MLSRVRLLRGGDKLQMHFLLSGDRNKLFSAAQNSNRNQHDASAAKRPAKLSPVAIVSVNCVCWVKITLHCRVASIKLISYLWNVCVHLHEPLVLAPKDAPGCSVHVELACDTVASLSRLKWKVFAFCYCNHRLRHYSHWLTVLRFVLQTRPRKLMTTNSTWRVIVGLCNSFSFRRVVWWRNRRITSAWTKCSRTASTRCPEDIATRTSDEQFKSRVRECSNKINCIISAFCAFLAPNNKRNRELMMVSRTWYIKTTSVENRKNNVLFGGRRTCWRWQRVSEWYTTSDQRDTTSRNSITARDHIMQWHYVTVISCY